MNLNIVCKLPELEKVLTQKVYRRIDLRDNPLIDSDLECLKFLSHLEILNLSGTKITGTCLPMIMQIPGLQHLNIASNSALDLNQTLSALFECELPIQLETLNISDISFDILQLIGLIDHAFKLANGRFKKLILGELTHLDVREWETLYSTIQKLEAEHHIFDIIESSAIKQVTQYRS